MNLDSLLANWQAVLTAVVVFVTISLLLLSQRAPDMVMIGGVVVLLAAGVLTPEEALKGMSNEGMLTVAALFVVAAAIERTGGLAALVERLAGATRVAGIGTTAQHDCTSGRFGIHEQHARCGLDGAGDSRLGQEKSFQCFQAIDADE